MIFWLLLLIAVISAAALTLLPLLRQRHFRTEPSAPQRPGKNIDVYKAQLEEVEADLRDDRLSPGEATAARLEIERRLLKTAAEAEPSSERPQASLMMLGSGTAVIILAATALYLSLGMAGMPDFPLKNQDHSPQAQSNQSPQSLQLQQEMIALTAEVQQNPEKALSWRKLGQLHSRLQNRALAAQAFQKWHELSPNDATAAVVYGESLIMLSDGRVSPAALLVLKQAQARQPRNPGVRHYLALAAYQAGNVEQALSSWKALEADSAEGAPWLGQLRGWVRRAERDLGLAAADLPAAAPALSAEERDAIGAMSKEEQLAMIKNMVGRLQEKMAANPENIEGWFRLTKAYMVLGQKQDAIHALEQALDHASPDLQGEIKKQLEILRK